MLLIYLFFLFLALYALASPNELSNAGFSLYLFFL